MNESKSSTVSIDVYSLCFKQCKNIYPHKLVRPLGRYKIDSKKQLGDVLNDLKNNNIQISQYIADNLKRSDAKDCKCHSAWYPCEYCYAKGSKIEISENTKAKKKLEHQKQLIQEKIDQCENEPFSEERQTKIQHLISLREELKKSINALNRKTNILWPSSTMYSQHRSRRSVLEIVRKIENNEILSIDESKGILGRSLLLDVPNFNYIYDAPAEYLHSGCLGVIKRLVELTFDVGQNRKRNTNRKLSSIKKFNSLMSGIKVLKEFSRRARNLDFSVFKGQEFRNLCIIFFPLVLECIEKSAKERHLWLYLAYMLRSSTNPSSEYSQININLVHEICEKFYVLFEQLFGEINCPYNLHVLVAHLTEIRTHGPLTDTSAFKFESFYGEIRHSFVPDTISPLKQVMKNIYMKRTLKNHTCDDKIFLSNYDTPMECNKYVYSFSRNQYHLYEISEINRNVLTCHKVGKYPAYFPETPELDWSTVGVFKKGGVCSETVDINMSDIHGKAVVVEKYILTVPNNVLSEK